MNSTEFIRECQENDYGTAIYIVDDSGNEYEVEDIGTIMFGQFHLYLKIKNYGLSKDMSYGFPHGLPLWIMDQSGVIWKLKVNKDTYKLYYGNDTKGRLYEVDYFGDVSIERAVESMKNVLKFNGYV
jgi:hypothetical protein